MEERFSRQVSVIIGSLFLIFIHFTLINRWQSMHAINCFLNSVCTWNIFFHECDLSQRKSNDFEEVKVYPAAVYTVHVVGIIQNISVLLGHFLSKSNLIFASIINSYHIHTYISYIYISIWFYLMNLLLNT